MFRTKRRKVFLALGVLCLYLLGRAWFVFGPPGERATITISKETTFITEPLKADGRPDYLRAINEKLSAGVTPENNGAVLFFQAIGPKDVSPELRTRFFAMLGMPVPPEDGPYFVGWRKIIEKLKSDPGVQGDKKILDSLEYELTIRPWTADQYPTVADWLKTNEVPLDVLVKASRKPQFYLPLVGGNGDGITLSEHFPDIITFRDVVQAFLTRSMFNLQQGKVADAWDDLFVARRLARFVGCGPSGMNRLAEFAYDQATITVMLCVLHDPRCDAPMIARMKADVATLPITRPFVDRIDSLERLSALDAAIYIADAGLMHISGPITFDDNQISSFLHRRVVNAGIDWDETLRVYNSCFDRLIEVYSMPEGPKKQAAQTEFRLWSNGLKNDVVSAMVVFAAVMPLPNLRSANGRRAANVLLSMRMSGYNHFFVQETRAKVIAQMTDVAFALASYRVDNGDYPDKLDALVPKFIPSLPNDPFSTGPFLYRRTDDCYVIYSVGPDGKDGGGEQFDSKEHPGSDDIALWAGKKPVPPKKPDPPADENSN